VRVAAHVFQNAVVRWGGGGGGAAAAAAAAMAMICVRQPQVSKTIERPHGSSEGGQFFSRRCRRRRPPT